MQKSAKMSETADNKTSKAVNNAKRLMIIGLGSLLIFIGSFVVNILQLINYLTVRSINIDHYRYLNSLFQYAIYSRKSYDSYLDLRSITFPNL